MGENETYNVTGDRNFFLQQINTAARGMISGSLSEWPYLVKALAYFGLIVDINVNIIVVRDICEVLIMRERLLRR